jgi:hypothetical protein
MIVRVFLFLLFISFILALGFAFLVPFIKRFFGDAEQIYIKEDVWLNIKKKNKK